MSWDARDYARNSEAQAQWARELLGKLELAGDERVLDIGSGDGKVTAEIARRLPRGSVLGIDSSPEMVAAAASSFPPERFPNLSFREMDAARIRLPAELDVTFSNATLHWVRDHEEVLRGVRSCLKRGGRLLFQMGGRGNASDMFAVVVGVAASPRWADRFTGFVPPYNFVGTDEYRRWLPTHGFRIVRVELIPRDMQHPDRGGLEGWLRTTWFPWGARLGDEERPRFWAEILDRYLEAFPPDAGGRTHVAMVRLEVEAVAA